MTRIAHFVLAVLLVAIPLGAHAEVSTEAGPLAGCPPGADRFLATGDARLRELDIRDGNAALLPGCRASKVQLTPGERGSAVAAEWPSCEGAAKGVRLEGRIHGAFCEHFDGTVRMGKDEPRAFHADLVSCRKQYPNEGVRKTTVARAVTACLAELQGNPWKDAQDFGRLYFAVQAKLGCALDNPN
jgi:hypothetical protein